METIAYSGAILTGFVISQTYNYFFGGSMNGSDSRSNAGNSSGPVSTNINIHTHHHNIPTSIVDPNNSKQIQTSAYESSVIIPKSLLYDIEVFANDELKPIKVSSDHLLKSDSDSKSETNSHSELVSSHSSLSFHRLTMENELRKRLTAIRKHVQYDSVN